MTALQAVAGGRWRPSNAYGQWPAARCVGPHPGTVGKPSGLIRWHHFRALTFTEGERSPKAASCGVVLPIICFHWRHRSVGCPRADVPRYVALGPGPGVCASARRALWPGRPGARCRRRITGLPSGSNRRAGTAVARCPGWAAWTARAGFAQIGGLWGVALATWSPAGCIGVRGTTWAGRRFGRVGPGGLPGAAVEVRSSSPGPEPAPGPGCMPRHRGPRRGFGAIS